jgi:hypothetical protein
VPEATLEVTETEETPIETEQKWVYVFEEGNGENKSLFGGKGRRPLRNDARRIAGAAGADCHHGSMQRLLREQ